MYLMSLMVEDKEHKDTIIRVLENACDEGEIDFAFNLKVDGMLPDLGLSRVNGVNSGESQREEETDDAI